ncbi:MAG TPA: flagellar basal body rod protein FlgC [Tepidisphaeraceae bacterium]|nr:flagellar basal body rod protein FlgC [Tepidisphaeraceae bacterium]
MFDALDIPASALLAQRARMDTISANVANSNTLRGPDGEKSPYRRRFVVFAAGRADDASLPGVHLQSVEIDQSPLRQVYDPGHPDADKDGYVKYPNVDLAVEQVNMIEASRAYEANVTMMDTLKAMINSTLRLIA